ncbi:hypothetical protein J6590_104215 [Homalodisca vitripennis]|nr:hypothetical protein J6590_104215 [Homalodisca vitripennis]
MRTVLRSIHTHQFRRVTGQSHQSRHSQKMYSIMDFLLRYLHSSGSVPAQVRQSLCRRPILQVSDQSPWLSPGIQCPHGQQYQACGSTCAHSCSDLGRECPRHWQCVEGCYCPSGHTLDPRTGECVSVATCPCQHHGMEYPPNHKEIRPGTKALQFWSVKYSSEPGVFFFFS